MPRVLMCLFVGVSNLLLLDDLLQQELYSRGSASPISNRTFTIVSVTTPYNLSLNKQ